MVANVRLMQWDGPPTNVVKTDKTNGEVRLRHADSPIVDSAHPISVPRYVPSRSFDVWLRLYVATPGPNVELSGLTMSVNSTFSQPPGATVYVRTINPAAWQYAQPSDPGTDDGYTPIMAYTLASPKNMDASTSGSPYRGYNFDIGDFLVMHVTLAPGVETSPTAVSLGGLQWNWSET